MQRDPTAHPADIEAPGWIATLKRVYGEIAEDHVGLIAAGCAFYGLLAIFPGIVAVLAIAGLVTEPSQLVGPLERLASMLPQEAAQIVIDQATAVAGSEDGGLSLAATVGLLVAVWSSSNAIRSIMEGLNVAFETTETRGFIRLTLTRILLTLGLMAGFFLTALILAGLPALLAFLPWSGAAEMVVTVLRWPLIIGLVVIGLAILYRYGPDRDVAWRWVTPGAGLAAVVWAVGSFAFAVYVRNFGSYNETFGTLGGVVILLTWLWLSAFIVMMGAEFDSEMERQAKIDPEGDDEMTPESPEAGSEVETGDPLEEASR